jgi:hypothetical protein
MTAEIAYDPPALYRSEAFVEDLEPALLPVPLSRARGTRLAAWLVAVPSAVAALASAAMLGLPA